MDHKKLETLLHDMTLREKIGQVFQISGQLLAEDSAAMGPMQEMGVTQEDVLLAGTVLGVFGAEKICKIQKEYMEHHPHHIPLYFEAVPQMSRRLPRRILFRPAPVRR